MSDAARQANDLWSESWDASDPRAARQQVRNGAYTGYTAGIAPGFVQANICILPVKWAGDFLLYCQRNPRPCPLIACSDVGDPRLPTLSDDLDIRTDVPRYHIFRDGAFVEEVTDIRPHWCDDLVTFALGCSFSFEEALQEAGVRLKSVQITSRFPNVHGAPVHLGDPKNIGVDLSRRYLDVGDPEVDDDELPVFWACGLTPQLAVKNARPPLCITHAPSSMLITDLRNASLAVL